MSDEDGVEERYRPTKSNLVRPLFELSPDPRVRVLTISLLQRREIGALCHGAQPGDRRVFYCMDLPNIYYHQR